MAPMWAFRSKKSNAAGYAAMAAGNQKFTPAAIGRHLSTVDATASIRFVVAMVALALFQPDIPQNTGTILRLAACLGVTVHVIGPTGFELSDRSLKRAGMDYLGHATLIRHVGWTAFETWRRDSGGRLVLMTTKASAAYTSFSFAPDDVILLGRESAGVPDEVHETADHRLLVPMVRGLRSINVAMTAAMALAEALRQTGTFPPIEMKDETGS